MISNSKFVQNYNLYQPITEEILEPSKRLGRQEMPTDEESLSPEEWGIINTVIYADRDPTIIRQVCQCCKGKEEANDACVANFLFGLGEKIFARKKYSVAKRLYSAVIAMNPDFVPAYIRRAEVLDWQEKHDQALKVLNDALEIFPDNTDILQYAAELLEFQDEYEEAARYYRRLVGANPEDPKPFLLLIQLLVDHRLYNELAEIADIMPLPQLDTRQVFRVLNLFVVAYEKTKQYEKMISFADNALQYKPKRIALWEKKAKVFMKLKNKNEALRCLNQICRIKPQAKKYVEMRDTYAIKHKLA